MKDVRAVAESHPGSAPLEVHWSDGDKPPVALHARSIKVAAGGAALQIFARCLGRPCAPRTRRRADELALLLYSHGPAPVEFERPLAELEKQIEELKKLGRRPVAQRRRRDPAA
jgi:hypothetical protein